MNDTPAGWYPAEDGRVRWWDGNVWTDHYQAASPPSVQPTAPDAASGILIVQGYNGTVSFDGDFVTIQRKGAFARLTIGKGDKRIPVSSISSVQWKPPGAMVNGFISFSLAGGNEKQSRFGSQTSAAANDENSVIVSKKQGPDFERLRAAIEQAIAERGRPAQQVIMQSPVAPAAPSPIEQLRQLGELHQAGVVTDEEFATKKAELLSRM